MHEQLKSWLKEDSDLTTQQQIETIPSIAGAKNQSAKNTHIPLVLGKHLYTPRIIGSPYTTISGEDGENLTYHALFLLGQKDLEVSDVKFGTIRVSSEKTDSDGFLTIDSDSLYNTDSYNTRLELQQNDAEVSLYSQKVVQDDLNIELMCLENGANVAQRISAKYPSKIEVEFTLNGLINFETTSREASVSLNIEYSTDGGTNWQTLATPTITRAKAKVMRFAYSKEFTKDEVYNCTNNRVEIRIQRTNQQDTDNENIVDTVYLSAIRTWCYDYSASKETTNLVPQVPIVEKYRNMTSRLGLEVLVKENDVIEYDINSVNMILQSKARIWNGESWTTEKYPTSNPAALALMVMQHETRGAENIYTDNEIDLESFGACYDYCQNYPVTDITGTQTGITCNGVLTTEKKSSDVLDMILSTARAFMIMNGTKRGILIDNARENVVMILNNQNVLEASNSKQFEKLPDGYKIRFIDEYAGYQENEIIVLYDDSKKNDIDLTLESIEVSFQTNASQVYRYGKYLLACRKLRPEVWQRKVSVEGGLIEIGSLVEIQDDTLAIGIGEGAEIIELIKDAQGNILGIKTDGLFAVSDFSLDYGVKIMQTNGYDSPVIRTAKVQVADSPISDFYFSESIAYNDSNLPSEGDIIAFGVYDKITTKAICFGKKDNGDCTYDLTFIPYDENVYSDNLVTIPDFDSKVTMPISKNKYTQKTPAIPKGEKGEKGDKGDTGPQGEKGESGPQGADGKNAIAMTSATTPNGEYEGQTGFYNGQIYQWNGSAWVKKSATLPTDAVLHYSFDDLPSIPDGTNTFTGQIAGSSYTKVDIEGGYRFTLSGNDPYIHFVSSIGSVSSFVLCYRQKAISKTGGSYIKESFIFYTDGSYDSITHLIPLPSETEQLVQVVIPCDNTKTVNSIRLDMFTGTGNSAVVEVTDMYIGNGNYVTPAIDNSGNGNNATTTKGVAVKGISGKGIYLTEGCYLKANALFDVNEPQEYAISCWFNVSNEGMPLFNNRNAYTITGLGVWIDNGSINLYCFDGKSNTTPLGYYTYSLDTQGTHHIAIQFFKNSPVKLYYDGVLQTNGVSNIRGTPAQTENFFQIGRNPLASGYRYGNGWIDDFQLFDRVLTEQEVLGLYLAKGNTPKQFTINDYRLNLIDDDGIISVSEKLELLRKWKEIYNAENVSSTLPTTNISAIGEYKSIVDTATTRNIQSLSSITNYISKANAIRNALWGTDGYLVNMQIPSSINTSIDTLFAEYKQALQDATNTITQGTMEFCGTEVDTFAVSDRTFSITTASTGITSSSMQILVGDTYLHTVSQDVWVCVSAGTPTTAKWRYQGRRTTDKDSNNVFRLFTPKTDYGQTFSTVTKEVVIGENPFGETSELLKATNTNPTISYSSYTPLSKANKIDKDRTYRYVCYIKQTSSVMSDYFGLQSYITSGQYIGKLTSGTATNAAYFTSSTNFGTLGRWYMVVGYVVANGTTVAPSDSGVYDMVTKKKIRDVTNFQWLSTAVSINSMGTLICYSGSAGTKTDTSYLYDMRLDMVDGSEPTLNELLYGNTDGVVSAIVPQRTPKYLGTHISNEPETVFDDLNIGDWFLFVGNTTSSTSSATGVFKIGRIYQWNGTTWDEDSNDSHRMAALNDLLDFMNFATSSEQADENYGTSFGDIFCNSLISQNILAKRMEALEVRFKNMCASIEYNDSGKTEVGQQLISMGKNPKDANDTDFSFTLQRCIQAKGTDNEEIWMKHLWTKFSDSKLLGMGISGSFFANEDVEINAGDFWKKSNIETEIGIINKWIKCSNGEYLLFPKAISYTEIPCYSTKDWVTFERRTNLPTGIASSSNLYGVHICFENNGTVVVVGETRETCYSTNFGKTWISGEEVPNYVDKKSVALKVDGGFIYFDLETGEGIFTPTGYSDFVTSSLPTFDHEEITYFYEPTTNPVIFKDFIFIFGQNSIYGWNGLNDESWTATAKFGDAYNLVILPSTGGHCAFADDKILLCGSPYLIYSEDGITFTKCNDPFGYSSPRAIVGIEKFNNIYVAWTSLGDIATSLDGKKWTMVVADNTATHVYSNNSTVINNTLFIMSETGALIKTFDCETFDFIEIFPFGTGAVITGITQENENLIGICKDEDANSLVVYRSTKPSLKEVARQQQNKFVFNEVDPVNANAIRSYIAFPNGLVMQWGFITKGSNLSAGADWSPTINFGYEWSDTNYCLQLTTQTTSSGEETVVKSKNTSSALAMVYNRNGSNTIVSPKMNWFAIGLG